jgi:hypothetical protein
VSTNAGNHESEPARVPTQVDDDAATVAERVDCAIEVVGEGGHPDVEANDPDTFAGRGAGDRTPLVLEVGEKRRQIRKVDRLAGRRPSPHRQHDAPTIAVTKYRTNDSSRRTGKRRIDRARKSHEDRPPLGLGTEPRQHTSGASPAEATDRVDDPPEAHAGPMGRRVRYDVRDDDVAAEQANRDADVARLRGRLGLSGRRSKRVLGFLPNDAIMRLTQSPEHLCEHGSQLAKCCCALGFRPELVANALPIDPAHRRVVMRVADTIPHRIERRQRLD